MEELLCTSCGLQLSETEPHCSKCQQTMSCTDGVCSCSCGNVVKLEDIKCDECLMDAS